MPGIHVCATVWRFSASDHLRRTRCPPAIELISAKRMQIEETIRDLKCNHWRIPLRYARTKHTKRLQTLLLIAALTTLTLWLLDLVATDHQWGRHFQANTARRRNVPSTAFLDQALWHHYRFKVPLAEQFHALKYLKFLLIQEAQYA